MYSLPPFPHDFITLIAHLAFLLNATAFLFKDILYLRAFAICASSCDIYYNLQAEDIDWISVNWEGVFICINLYRIIILVREIIGVHFSKEERTVYQKVFSNFTPLDFFKFIRLAKLENFDKDQTLVQQGKTISHLYLIFKGGAKVEKNNQLVAKLVPYAFVGEMAFTTHNYASATVTIDQDSKVFVWQFDKLEKLMRGNRSIQIAFQLAVGVDMAKKLNS